MSNEAEACKPFVRPATAKDVIALAEIMRECDRKEIWHIARVTPLEALVRGFRSSDVPYAVEWQGRCIAMFGVSGEVGNQGVPWMLASEDIKKVAKTFLKECRGYVLEMHQKYPVLTNAVWAKNTVHINWLKWLGFTFLEPVAIGEDGELFIPFIRTNHV